MIQRIRSVITLPFLSILLALLVAAVLMIVSSPLVRGRFDPLLPLAAYAALLEGAFGSVNGIIQTVVSATPLILAGLAVGIGFKAGLFNIGAQGQFLMGAVTAAAVGAYLADSSGLLAIPAALLAGLLAGAVWGLIPGALKAYTGAHEVVTTIMLNYIALNLLLHCVHGPLKDPAGFNFPESAMFGDASRLPPLLEDLRVHVGLYFALAALVVVWVLLQRSFLGFQIKVLGLDPRAAGFVGFREKRLVWLVLLVSGGLAGLAGVGEVTGPIGQLVPQVSPGYGYAAITVAFLGRLNPFGILLAGLLMALLYLGGENAQMAMNLPQSITELFQGMMLFFLLACDVLILYRPRLALRWGRRERVREAMA